MSFYLSNCNISTANISDVKMCETIEGFQCPEDNPVFGTDASQFYCSCVLNNAPEGTQLNFAWYYLEGEKVLIDEVTVEADGTSSTYNMQSSLSRPDNGWPTGNYEVVLELDTDNSQPITKSFKVE